MKRTQLRSSLVASAVLTTLVACFAGSLAACSSSGFRVADDDAGAEGDACVGVDCDEAANRADGSAADASAKPSDGSTQAADSATSRDANTDATTDSATTADGATNDSSSSDGSAADSATTTTDASDGGATVDSGPVDSGTPLCAIGTRLLGGSCVSAFREDQISAGDNSACFITPAGAAKCWGWNAGGKLGNGNNSSQGVPNDVVGLGSGVVAIGAGYYSACAVLGTGSVKCWGSNADGELGNATLPTGNSNGAASNVPVDVDNLTDAVTVSVGLDHACALTSSGGVRCWGHGLSGELGNAADRQSNVPVAVQGLGSGVVSVRCGWRFSCALTSGGAVKCWGSNSDNQLGNPAANTGSNVPFDVSGLSSGVVAIETSSRTACAVLATGGIKCWGSGEDNWLGSGNNNNAPTPVDVVGLSGTAIGVTAGGGYGCALLSNGAVDCWGKNNYGAFGINSVSGAVTSISGGGGFACALSQRGDLRCSGQGDFGQLGNGLRTTSSGPVLVTGL